MSGINATIDQSSSPVIEISSPEQVIDVSVSNGEQSSIEVNVPDVSKVFAVSVPVSSVVVVDKYSIVGLEDDTDKSYVFDQMVPSDVWDIYHALNKFPSVSVVDSSDRIVIGDVEYINQNLLRVTFNGSFAGKAYLN